MSARVLRQETSPHYRAGEWNTLKVRVEKEKMRCFVNDELVFEVADAELTGGRVGLVKFRDTVAQFKQFQRGGSLAAARIPDAVSARISRNSSASVPTRSNGSGARRSERTKLVDGEPPAPVMRIRFNAGPGRSSGASAPW